MLGSVKNWKIFRYFVKSENVWKGKFITQYYSNDLGSRKFVAALFVID